jgi:hypothetical protein
LHAKKPDPMEVYQQIIEDRPHKLSGEDVGYRKGEDKFICGRCLHFFERGVDGFGVCELVRLKDDEPIKDDKVCDYWTKNGEDFPLLYEPS